MSGVTGNRTTGAQAGSEANNLSERVSIQCKMKAGRIEGNSTEKTEEREAGTAQHRVNKAFFVCVY